LRCHYFTQYIADAAEKKRLFEEEQQKFYSGDSLLVSDSFSAMNAEITRRRLLTIQAYLSPGASIIEAGPGAGDVLLSLGGLGFKVTGVECAEVLATRLQGRPNVSVLRGDFAEQSLPPASYDAYCSFHVIEHVVDFKSHLDVARNCVKPGGYAFLATPNARGWEHRLPMRLSPNYDSSHFQLFSPDSLTRVLVDSGWEVRRVFTPSYTIAWLRVVTKVLRRIRGQDESATGGAYARSTSKRLKAMVMVFAALTRLPRVLQETLRGGNEQFIVARRVR
jgi:2-polyprenyl-3-methyl-5-hydroxy-6-metoxy-1,4-benzoquinol methylase